jgi:TolB protein
MGQPLKLFTPLTAARFLAALAAVTLVSTAQAQLTVEVRGVGSKQIPIAIANFAGEPTPPQDIPQIVRDDLVRSGQFKAVDAGVAPIGDSDPVDANAWKSRGADAVVVGSVRRGPTGQLTVRFVLYDTARNQNLSGIEITVPSPSLTRKAAHRIADYVYEKLTGDKGIFSTQIAYVSHSAGSYLLAVADADGQNQNGLVRSPQPLISPVWSPDGTKIAFVSFLNRKPEIYVINVLTHAIVPVSNFKGSNSAPAWSPDGQSLAVVLTRDGNSQIYLMGADGSHPTRLTRSNGIDTEPFFSPDGQSIYFTSDRNGGPQIFRMPVGGGEAARVTFNGDYNTSPRISPDGKSLAYVSRRGGKFQIYLLDLASGQELPLTDTSADESPSFAPNSKMLIYATVVGRGILGMVSADASVHERISSEQAGDVREPSWGPFNK